MRELRRSPENPVLLPNREHPWEAEAAFNGSVVKERGTFHLCYRAVSSPQKIGGVTLELSSIGHAKSRDGVHFTRRHELVKPEYLWEQYGCEDPRVTKCDGRFFIFYTALSAYPFSAEGIKVGVAVTKDFEEIQEKHLVTPFNAKAMALFPEKINGKIAAILTADTDRPPAKLGVASFDTVEEIWSPQYWKRWYENVSAYTLPLQRTGNDHVEVGAPPVKTKYGWLLIYSYIQNYFAPSGRVFGVEAVLLDAKNPRKILAKTFRPILAPEEEYEQYGRVPNIVFPTGAITHAKKLYLYYGATDTTTCLATADFTAFLETLFAAQLKAARLRRFEGNPILVPRPEHPWEAKATFNPGAIYEGGRVHLFYRAMSEENTSVLGYAASSDGFRVDERLEEPVYVPREEFEKKLESGNSGCEDPRLTRIEGSIYMCYTAFDGKHPPRVALTSIGLEDFLRKRWRWSRPVLISPPDIDDKDAALFPKKFGGRFCFVHRIGSSIWLDSVEDLSALGKTRWLGGVAILKPRKDSWDSWKVGLAGPPIETPKGWLILYHGVSETSKKYRVGAALLDRKDPTKVLARTHHPLFEPEEPYEIYGNVPRVVFPCGHAVLGDELILYYGGADKVVGVAHVNLTTLLEELAKEKAKKRDTRHVAA
jgi:predicted GH43/DUF377 family glycosyl hydrolase